MINKETLRAFWNGDLQPLEIPAEIAGKLSDDTRIFLSMYGLPKSARIYREHENRIKGTTPFPSWKFSEEIVKAQSPFFEFDGKNFVKIGKEFTNDLAIEINSGSVFYLTRQSPETWPSDFSLIRIRFLNQNVEKLILFLTTECLFGRELIPLGKHYVEVINIKNKKLEHEILGVAKLIVDKLENEFREMDSDALTMSNGWWSDYLHITRTYLGVT